MHMHAIHMDCPRCGGRQATSGSRDAVCEFCAVNMPLFAKAQHMSAAHYDRGLELAKARNLTGAIDELRAALHINKKNIRARNLLGLCYYAVGRIGEALREWVISANYGADNNVAKDYLVHFQDDIPLLERFGDALHNYNEALQFMTQYSEDLAAIRLKRAVEINPTFVDALNLLTLFYIRTGERQKAGILVERVLAIDVGNPFARRYYREIFQKKVPPARKIRAQAEEAERNAGTYDKPTAQYKPERQNPFAAQTQRPVTKASAISGLLLFAAGLGAMFLFMYVLVLPSFLEDSLAESASLAAELSNRQVMHTERVAELEESITDLEDELQSYRQRTAQQDEHNLNLQNENWVNTAYSYLSQELAHEALAVLENVETTRLSADAMATYNHVMRTAMPIVEENYHQIGEIHFLAGEYDESRRHLERAAMHFTDESTVAHYVLYLLGRIAEVQEDYNMARIYYEMIINDFPGTNRVNSANVRLNQLP